MTHQAVLLTPPAPGAIAVVLLAGGKHEGLRSVPKLMRQLTGARLPELGEAKLLKLSYRGEVIDDALVLNVAQTEAGEGAIKGEVGGEWEERWEIHLHGGLAVVRMLLATLETLGTTILPPEGSEATRLVQRHSGQRGIAAEIVTTLPRAQTPTAVNLLAHQAEAGLEGWSVYWEKQIEKIWPQHQAWIFHSAVQWVLQRSQSLAHLLTPARIAIVGPPNAGKSTLANALLGRTVSITHHEPGTTRDWVDALALFTAKEVEVPVTLVDTAGIRATPDPLEAVSIKRTAQQMQLANVIIALVPAHEPPPESVQTWLAELRQQTPHCLVVLSKADQGFAWHPDYPHITIAALQQQGLDRLMSAVLHQLNLHEIHPDEPFAFTPRQKDLLEQLAVTDDKEKATTLLQQLRQG